MIVGVGVDVVDVARLSTALERTPALAARLFTPAERQLPAASLAARFAAKEAIAKALCAPGGLRWLDVEICGGTGGGSNSAPSVRTSGTVAGAAARMGVRRWHVSLSHDAGMAIAMVIAES